MAGIVEVDKLLKARAVLYGVAVTGSTAILAVGLGGRDRRVYLLTLAGGSIGALAVGLWRGRDEADQYVVRRRSSSRLPPRVTAARALLPELWLWGALMVALIVFALLPETVAAAGLGGGNASLIGTIAMTLLERRGWRRLMAQHDEQVWIATQPFWRIRSRSRIHYEGVFVLDERPVPAASVASGQ